ncbi:hypothetical protein [Mesorhizobium sp.]|uniref:hypothetical protein n=1 Tax=Mesorhizobium sp. TaxID=1871066 RepID=UPI0025C3210C|nr:hypothetical protein [Mesorhizobium sp.]
MALMARCRQIYAGGSIYAVAAAVMGDMPCLDASPLFGKRRADKKSFVPLNRSVARRDQALRKETSSPRRTLRDYRFKESLSRGHRRFRSGRLQDDELQGLRQHQAERYPQRQMLWHRRCAVPGR